MASLDRLRVQLWPSGDGVVSSIPGLSVPPSAPLNSDGTFKLDGVFPGEYRVTITGLEAGFYAKDIRYDQNDALNQPMQFTASESARMDVLISPNAGQIQGIVMNDRQQPVQGTQAILIPDRTRDRTELYKTTLTDQSGRFTMLGIPPGDYKVFAWEALEQFGYFDPDLMKRFEPQGKAVHIAESSKENIEVKIIPAPSQ